MEGKPNGSMKNKPMGVISVTKGQNDVAQQMMEELVPWLQRWRGPFSGFRVDSEGLQRQVRSWCASYGCEVRCWFPMACASFRRLMSWPRSSTRLRRPWPAFCTPTRMCRLEGNIVEIIYCCESKRHYLPWADVIKIRWTVLNKLL